MTNFLTRIKSKTYRRMVAGSIIGMAILLTLFLLRLAFEGGVTNLLLAGGVVVLLFALPACVWLFKNWRQTFYFILIILVFEGVVRNITNQVAVLLFKDFLLGLVYLGYLYENGWKFTRIAVFRPFNVAFGTLLVYSLVEMLNPSMPDITIGIIGLKTLLYYVPLAFIAYEIFDSIEQIKKFAVYIFILTFISCAFGFYQYFGGVSVIKFFQPVQVLQAYGSNGEVVSYKLPGSFASAYNFSSLLFTSFSIAMAFLYTRTTRSMRLLSLGTVIICVVMFAVNSQRAGLVYVALCFLLGTFAYSTSYWFRVIRIVMAVVLVGVFLVALSSDNNPIGSRFAEFTSGDALQLYLVANPAEQIGPQLDNIAGGRLFGLGIGTAAPGARYILGAAYEFIESFVALMLSEQGPLGLLFMAWLLTVTTVLIWRSYRGLKDELLRNFAFFTFIWMMYIVVSSITYSPLTVPPTSHFFWILPGIVLRVRDWSKVSEAARPTFLKTATPAKDSDKELIKQA